MRNEQDVCMAIERYADTVQRLCMVHLKNRADTEDIFQTVFLKYALHSASFANEEHEKAWFIRVTLNACKDLSRSLFRRRTVPLEEIAELPAQLTPDCREVLGLKRCFRFPRNTKAPCTCITTRATPPPRSVRFLEKV